MAPRSDSVFGRFQAFLKRHPEKRFTAREIADAWSAEHPDWYPHKEPERLAADITSNYWTTKKRNALPAELRSLEGNPRRFYWAELPDESDGTRTAESNREPVEGQDSRRTGEQGLYKPLIEYMNGAFPNMNCRRIHDTRSSNKGGKGVNKWLHPDVVGSQLLSADWTRDVLDVGSNMPSQKVELWSFEVKTHLQKGNVRESFFQAVANSSWANHGYLVAEEIDDAAFDELRLLSQIHGIGLIRVDREQPLDSTILLPARIRPHFDLAACNRLATENSDFQRFMEDVVVELKVNRQQHHASRSVC